MANTFYEAITLFESLGKNEPDTVWVEIGSERGEGSTLALAGQAQRWGTVLHSVDISDRCQNTLSHPALICHVSAGSTWAKNYPNTIDRPISLLHLDNFDWIWEPANIPEWIREQIIQYQKVFGVVMNNRNCQVEHLRQMLYLFPHMHEQCMIAMDDTYLRDTVWTGKCGAVAVYLEANGFETVYTTDSGTIMVRGFPALTRLTLTTN